MNEHVTNLFKEMLELLREARKKGWIDPASLGNYDRVVQENIHAKMVGLTALAAFRLGFLIEVEAK